MFVRTESSRGGVKCIHFHLLVYEMGTLFPLLTAGVADHSRCQDHSPLVRVRADDTETSLTSAELCLRCLPGQGQRCRRSQRGRCHHVIQRGAEGGELR